MEKILKSLAYLTGAAEAEIDLRNLQASALMSMRLCPLAPGPMADYLAGYTTAAMTWWASAAFRAGSLPVRFFFHL